MIVRVVVTEYDDVGMEWLSADMSVDSTLLELPSAPELLMLAYRKCREQVSKMMADRMAAGPQGDLP